MVLQHASRIVAALSLMFIAVACSTDNTNTNSSPKDAPLYVNGDVIPGQYIVVFNTNAVAVKGESLQSLTPDTRIDLVNQAASRAFDKIAVSSDKVEATFGTVIQGVVVTLTDEQLNRLRQDPSVKYIEQDRTISLPPLNIVFDKGEKVQAQTTPWGITKVGGSETPASTTTAYIVDTGLDLNHPDLNIATSGPKSFVKGQKTAEDGHGHGSHVGGTVGAKDNSVGVIGVAPGVKLVSMRVLSNNGSGQFSWSISAFDWIASHANTSYINVVNYSVGPGSRYTSTTLDAAVKGMADEGIVVCVAAGNSEDDATYYSPARVNYANVYTIASMGSDESFSDFSNYGGPVDWIEPGEGVYSTFKGDGYATMSGTSMATPHATGMFAVGGITAGGDATGVPAGTTTEWGVRD